ncbi:MAG: helix-turn-helix domain-containing protein [Propionibacteriaceae bacterium]|jgi:transcriptional regulator with XRE-family HTH domain|nr:helix-turn-helix domain-containing protein [Propionibacteriaceae bacterium]
MFTTPREAGILLRGLREQAELSRADLAAKAGVSVRWLSAFELGKPAVDLGRVLDCFQVLGCGFEARPLAWPEM